MKANLILAITIFLATTKIAYSQTDTTAKTFPLYWTFEFGATYLTGTDLVSSKSPSNFNTLSGSWYFYWDIPLSKECDKQLCGFSIAPGLGFGLNTLNINKTTAENNGTIEFIPITQNYLYSSIEGTYIDVPLDFRYITRPNGKRQNFSFELGAKYGYLIFSQTQFESRNGDTTTITDTHIDDLNKTRFGISGKISYRKLRIAKDKEFYGYALSILTNYYISDMFKNINPHYYSIGLGYSFIF